MKTLLAMSVWFIVFFLCWPLAILAVFAWPIVWLISLPFLFLGITFYGVFALLSALFTLPARLLGWKPSAA